MCLHPRERQKTRGRKGRWGEAEIWRQLHRGVLKLNSVGQLGPDKCVFSVDDLRTLVLLSKVDTTSGAVLQTWLALLVQSLNS